MVGALEIKQLNFSFASNSQTKPFFENLSISFPFESLHFVRGQNGVGKSTLFNLLRGIVLTREKVTGSIILDGVVYRFDSENREEIFKLQDHIKLVQQNFDLMLADQLTFAQNLQAARMGMFPHLGSLPAMLDLPAFVQRFNVPLNKPVHLLSGGQRQMLAILMALQKPTKVLLLDEPTAALDAHNAFMIMEFLKALVVEKKLTILIISHDLELVERYSNNRYYEIIIDAQLGTRNIQLIET